MKILFILPICAILSGCVCNPKIVDHNVLVSVPCKVVLPQKPLMPFTETSKVDEDIFVKTKKILAEITIREAYENELVTVARSCE